MQRLHRKNKDEEVLKVVKAIPYSSFKEKIRIMKQVCVSGNHVEVYKGFIYVESIGGRE